MAVRYGTAQFKIDIHMHILVQSLEKFVRQLASFSQAHDLWYAFDPHDELYASEMCYSVVNFTREQSHNV